MDENIKYIKKIILGMTIICLSLIFLPKVLMADNCNDECFYCVRPSVPSVIASATNETTINITESSAGTDYYTLRRGGVSLGTNTGSYNDTGRNPGTEYTYTANACDENCENCTSYVCGELVCWECSAAPQDKCSDFSGGTSETTAFYNPTGLSASCSLVSNSPKIDISWNDNSVAETGYKVEENSGSGYSVVSTESVNATSYDTTSVTDGTWYYYRVRAYHSSGSYSSYSSVDSCLTPISVPTSFSATAISDSQINLSWTDNSTGESGFKIERATGSCSGFSQIATVNSNLEVYSDTGLFAGTTYCYRVRAYTSETNSSYSSTDSASTSIDAPTSFSATTISGSQINLSWTDNSTGESGFKIERATGSCSGFSQITTVGANATSYSNVGLSEGVTYCYRVRAYTATTDSNYSNTDTATTSITAPSNLSATTASSSQINLSWSDNSTGESGFKIERSSGGCSSFSQIDTTGANVSSYQDTSVSSGLTYCYRVRAYSGGTNSSYSNTDSATATLASPSNLSATTISTSRINLSWTDNSTGESGFKIERATGSCSGFSQITTVGASSTSYSDLGLNQGVLYCYRVRAYTAVANSDYSTTDSATTNISAPTSLSATSISGSQINLSWSDNSSGENGFKIERATDSCSGFSQIDTVGANITSYSSTGLSNSTTYCYRVRAYTTATNSTYSNTDSAITKTPPTAPSSLVASVISSTQIDLSWSDESDNETGFRIRRVAGSSCDSESDELTTTSAGAVSYNNTGLSNGVQYCFVICAYNNDGENCSASDTATTTLLPPTSFNYGTIGQSSISFNWTDNSTGEDGFKIERTTAGCSSGFSQIDTSTSASYTDSTLSCNSDSTAYCYRVRAYTADSNSSYLTAGGEKQTLPCTPTSLSATAISGSQINVSWTDNSANETEFRLDRKIGLGGNWALSTTTIANDTTHSDTGLTDGIVYYYRTRACNADGCSGYSDTDFATTTLSAPSNFACVVSSSSQINLTWDDNSSNETSFSIERATSSPTTIEVASVGQNATSYNDTNLLEQTEYFYRVRAYNSNTNVYSNYTSECSTSTLIYVPTGNLTSSIFDTGLTNGAAFNFIKWRGVQPSGSRVLFQFASSNSTSSWEYFGHDGTGTTYYESAVDGVGVAPAVISTRFHNNHRYFRYRIYLYPNESAESPLVDEVVIGYSP